MEKSTQEQKIHNKKVVRRSLGENFLLVQKIEFAASAKQAGGVYRRGDEAAAMDDYHERSGKENQIRRKHGCQKPLAGLGVACEGL